MSNVVTRARLALAPMVKVTTPPFLQLASLTCPAHVQLYTEMRHARVVIEHPERISRIFGPPRPGRLVVQLGGSDPGMLGEAAGILQTRGYDHINLNCGCPSQGVQAGSFGAVLMKDPTGVSRILRSMHDAAPSLHLSVKCRVGVDDLDSPESLDGFISCVTEDTGVEEIIIHARKAWLDGLSPKENRQIPSLQHDRVYAVKQAHPHLYIHTNGGVSTIAEALAHLVYVDAVMVGRKARESPMFLAECVHALHGVPPPRISDVISQYSRYAEEVLCGSGDVGRKISPHWVLAPLESIYRGAAGRVFRQHLHAHLPILKDGPTPPIIHRVLTEAVEIAETAHHAQPPVTHIASHTATASS